MAQVFKGIFFGARGILKPGVYATVNADAMVPNRVGPGNTIGVIGVAEGGIPRTPTTINSPIEAREQLRGGVLLSVIELMYDPSGQVPGAGEIIYQRLNQATQATLTLKDSGAANVITVTSRDYGVWTNQIRMKIEAGSVSGLKVTVNNMLEPTIFEVGDNLGPAFTIQYVGALANSRMTITKTGDAATNLKLESSADGIAWQTDADVDLTNSSVGTMGALVDFLDNLADYTVTLDSESSLSVSELDSVSNQDVKTASYGATANIGAILHFLNTQSQLVTATRVTGASNAPAQIVYTLLSGGSEGPVPTNSDWSAAIDDMADQNIQFLFVCSEDPAIHAMALAHCTAMSDVKVRKERVTIVGGALNKTVEQAVADAQALADKRAVYCYPGIKRRNLLTGDIDLLSPMYTAALVCGMAAGVTPETPLTFKQVRVSGLEKILTETEIERLLDRGVLPLEFVQTDGIYRIVQAITTYLVDANVVWRKLAGVRIADTLNREIRNSVQRFIGTVADKRQVNLILDAARSKLNQLTRSETNLTGVLTPGTNEDGSPEPAFKNLRAVFDGFDLVALTYEAHPVGEVAYITITAALTPTKIVAT